jgi:RNA polymerase sigma-70 factor (ECF subfamily)
MSAPDHREVDTSLEDFLKRVRPRLKAQFQRYGIPPQDTEDILQQSLLALIYQRQAIRDTEAWLIGTVRNKCLLYWRAHRRKLYESVDAAVLECIAQPLQPAQESSDVRRDLAAALEDLPERCRSLLTLRYEQGYEPSELAEQLGYSQNSISKITQRCLAALTRRLVLTGQWRGKKTRP